MRNPQLSRVCLRDMDMIIVTAFPIIEMPDLFLYVVSVPVFSNKTGKKKTIRFPQLWDQYTEHIPVVSLSTLEFGVSENYTCSEWVRSYSVSVKSTFCFFNQRLRKKTYFVLMSVLIYYHFLHLRICSPSTFNVFRWRPEFFTLDSIIGISSQQPRPSQIAITKILKDIAIRNCINTDT